MSLQVLRGGLLTTLQDAGRVGHAAIGVGRAGAMDDVALRLANALVGNPPGTAALEVTLRGPLLRFNAAATIAFCGADFALRRNDVPVAAWRPLPVANGSLLDIGAARRGCRGYLAVAGGFRIEPVLGSASIDVNAALGPFEGRPLAQGDVLPFAGSHDRPGEVSWSLDPGPWFDPDPQRPIRLLQGSHAGSFDASAHGALSRATFHVGAASNRVGLRLEGPALRLAAPLELASTPVAPGTLQVPPDGQPIVLMAEAPTTGGYPRIGQVATVDVPRLAQLRPGDAVRFAAIGVEEAQTRYLAREQALHRLSLHLHQRLRER